eukprot:scaffold28236_cov59-Phaeocystis_antarctica.AAC.9
MRLPTRPRSRARSSRSCGSLTLTLTLPTHTPYPNLRERCATRLARYTVPRCWVPHINPGTYLSQHKYQQEEQNSVDCTAAPAGQNWAATLGRLLHVRQLCLESGDIAGASDSSRRGKRARPWVVQSHVGHVDEHVVDDLVRR